MSASSGIEGEPVPEYSLVSSQRDKLILKPPGVFCGFSHLHPKELGPKEKEQSSIAAKGASSVNGLINEFPKTELGARGSIGNREKVENFSGSLTQDLLMNSKAAVQGFSQPQLEVRVSEIGMDYSFGPKKKPLRGVRPPNPTPEVFAQRENPDRNLAWSSDGQMHPGLVGASVLFPRDDDPMGHSKVSSMDQSKDSSGNLLNSPSKDPSNNPSKNPSIKPSKDLSKTPLNNLHKDLSKVLYNNFPKDLSKTSSNNPPKPHLNVLPKDLSKVPHKMNCPAVPGQEPAMKQLRSLEAVPAQVGPQFCANAKPAKVEPRDSASLLPPAEGKHPQGRKAPEKAKGPQVYVESIDSLARPSLKLKADVERPSQKPVDESKPRPSGGSNRLSNRNGSAAVREAGREVPGPTPHEEEYHPKRPSVPTHSLNDRPTRAATESSSRRTRLAGPKTLPPSRAPNPDPKSKPRSFEIYDRTKKWQEQRTRKNEIILELRKSKEKEELARFFKPNINPTSIRLVQARDTHSSKRAALYQPKRYPSVCEIKGPKPHTPPVPGFLWDKELYDIKYLTRLFSGEVV